MIVSTAPIVLVVCLTTLLIVSSTIVLLPLILPCSKFRDNNSTSAATGGGDDGKDNMVKLPYSTISLPPAVVTMSLPGWKMGGESGGRVQFCCVICGCINGGAVP
jgi:hypothetical protein